MNPPDRSPAVKEKTAAPDGRVAATGLTAVAAGAIRDGTMAG